MIWVIKLIAVIYYFVLGISLLSIGTLSENLRLFERFLILVGAYHLLFLGLAYLLGW
jgi:hypothetical protein